MSPVPADPNPAPTRLADVQPPEPSQTTPPAPRVPMVARVGGMEQFLSQIVTRVETLERELGL